VTLACIVVRNDLHKFMRYENHMLAEAIKKFVAYQESVEHQVTDLISLFEAEEESSASAESLDIPKSLGDLFESIIGAIFLDSGLSLIKTWNVIYHLMRNEIHQFIADVPKQVVRRLFEFQSGSANPKFFNSEPIPGENTVAVPLKFTCRGDEKLIVGIGKNKHLAKKAAAKKALIELENQ
jgi:endoribonuclease Dicer